MPWVVDPIEADPDEPYWYPYGYETKPKYVWQSYFGDYHWYGQPRLPPNYFTKGYKFYKKEMKKWYRNWGIDPNHPPENEDPTRLPLFYNYRQFVAKANKYARRKRFQLAVQRHRQEMLQRIQRNREIAQYRRQLIVKSGRNKY